MKRSFALSFNGYMPGQEGSKCLKDEVDGNRLHSALCVQPDTLRPPSHPSKHQAAFLCPAPNHCFHPSPTLCPAAQQAHALRSSVPVWLILCRPTPLDNSQPWPASSEHPISTPKRCTQNSHYLSESRSYLSRFLSGESICWNFSLRSFPLSLCLPFTTERAK